MAKVYFADMRARSEEENLLNKISRLFKKAGFDKIIEKDDRVAIKAHFGDLGNTTFVRPVFIRRIVDEVRNCGGKPFLTDTNTLYRGSRSDAIDHLNTATRHGFVFSVVNCPVIIADGLVGKDFMEIDINKKHFKKVKVSSAAYFADVIICVSHIKGHIATGFGGTLKNIGMGFGSRAGKLTMHSDAKPKINLKRCIGCGECVKWCPADAITISNKKAVIDYEKCIGCGECTITCRHKAIAIGWDTPANRFQEKVVEYAYGVLKEKKGRAGYFNFIMDLTPECDCPPWSDAPLVSNVGIAASKDPVAIDQASVDLVNEQEGIKGTKLKKSLAAGTNKFGDVHGIDWTIQLKYGEKIGLGTRSYELVRID
jgi:uncharacterized Fe-S center protein